MIIMNDNIKNLLEGQRIRERLRRIGIYPMVGPRGPKGDKGDGISILGDYDSYEELINNYPSGNRGDCYLVSGNLYVWNSEKSIWDNVGNIEGPPGKSEKISVGKVSSGSEATIIDNFDGEVHTLDFVIPRGQKGDKGDTGLKGDKGEKGDIGPQGEKGETGPIGPQGKQGIAGPPGIEGKIGPTGPQGPQGTLGPTSYNAVCFSSFKDTTNAGTMTVTTTRIIPGNSDIISISGNQIKVSKTSVFEVTLCGRISGVTNDTGGKFYLYNATTNEKISDMEFVLDKGTTSDMDFSEVNFVDVYAGGNLEIRTEVIGNDTGNISFSMVNVILKRYNL